MGQICSRCNDGVGVPVLCSDGRSEGGGGCSLQIGDWGRQGRWNQSETADAMAAAAQRAPPQFVVSVGDNFYPSGLTSAGDANFADSFQNVYHHAELQVDRCRQRSL